MEVSSDEGRIEGALTQGLRLLRQHADHSPISFSPPDSPSLFSPSHSNHQEELFTTAHDLSDFDAGFADENVVFESSSDVNEIPATPLPPPPLSITSTRLHSSPLRDTPIHNRLRSSSVVPKCSYCCKADGRKDTIRCVVCQAHIHSVSCGGFSSQREANHASFTCRKCLEPPTLNLPQASTPRVTNRVVIGLAEPPAINTQASYFPEEASLFSPPSSPITSSTQHSRPHTSPDHAHLASRTPAPAIGVIPPPPPRLPFSLDELFEARVVLLRHCPKTARRELASLFNSTWSAVLNNADNLDYWTKAFAVAKLVLFLPPGKKSFKDKAATVKTRIKAFQEGRLEELWQQATRQPKGRRPAAAPQAASNARRATMFAQEGQFGQAAKALLSQGLDFVSQEAVSAMNAKHPYSPPPPPLPPPNASPYSFTAAETLDALNSFHSLSAGGASGCRAAHLRESISSDRGNALLSTMTRLINFLTSGKTPASIVPFLCGGNLFAALKKSGGHRPIAVGETIRRWTAKCVAKKAIADSAAHLTPHQLGVGVKGGAEAIIHAAGAVFHDNSINDEDKWVLQVDFENAFNLISRSRMLEEVRKRCPKAAKWADTCYSSPSHLFFGNKRLSSST